VISVVTPSTPGIVRVAVPLWVLDALLKLIDMSKYTVTAGEVPVGNLKLIAVDHGAHQVDGAVVVVAAVDDLPEAYRGELFQPWLRDCWPRQNRVLLPGERPARA